MAPEVIGGKGYGLSADYWSVGVMLYELLCGILPFGDDEEGPYAIYECILKQKVEFDVSIESDA